ncbi:MAG TPA: penicillin-binding protein 1C [Candidatus Bathyarchaeia archaeon]|nr:penicillin-binding protein 1C [Candidatus Bathyarchaeia archaeon]
MDTTRYFAVSRSGEIVDRTGGLLYAFLNRDDQWCFYRCADDVGERVVEATLAAEDRRFYDHGGVDVLAVLRAAWQNLRHGRVVSGASTLTMQVVKNGEGRLYRRTLPGKVYEAVQAVRLDARADKREILESYLNTAPYGLNLVGVEAAARRYFGKPARELTLPEAALLAGLPKAPTRLMPLKYPEKALRRRNYVLDRMLAAGFITPGEHDEAAAADLGVSWHDFPAMSPHLAMQLRQRAQEGRRVEVTLDSAAQRTAEELVGRALKRHRPEITNAAVMVVDAASAEVLARVGSGGFYTTPGGGQVDLCRAPRSPGSALKPFTYALGLEQNVLYPSETLLDDTLDLGAYSPGNFDGGYNGLISASDALRHSLNVPAVLVLDRVGVPALDELLRSVGLTTLKRDDTYGLGLTLGNCEVRLDELSAAYAAVANLGEWRPLTTLRGEKTADERRRVLLRGTCLSLYQSLEQTLPNEWEPNVVLAGNTAPRVCFKTGTSTGYHDAWAFVFNAQYVVGVWMGNNDGKGTDRLVGVRAALPLAGSIMRALPVLNRPAWPEPADDLRRVTVCAVSGLPRSEWCARTKEAVLPAGQYLHRVCDVHRPIRGGDAVAEWWPGTARGWDLAKVGDSAHVAESARRANLRIQEPVNEAEYVLTGEPQGDRIRLRASIDAEKSLYWYINDRFFGQSSPDRPLLLELSVGEHTLACMALDGSLDRVTFRVSQPRGGLEFRRQS